MQYNATAELDIAPTSRRAAGWLEALAEHHPVVSRTIDGHAEITITIEADVLAGAAHTALYRLQTATGAMRSFTIITTAEYDRRTDEMKVGDLIGTAAAAEILGVSRQRIQQLANSGALPSQKIGRGLAIPLVAVTALKHAERRGEHAADA
jgi:excisionase family DNA binding protein